MAYVNNSNMYDLMVGISNKFKSIPLWVGTEAEHTTAVANGIVPAIAIVGIIEPGDIINNNPGGGGSGGNGGSGDPGGNSGSSGSGGNSGGSGGAVTPVSFSTGTEAELALMIEAAKNGNINLGDYWHVGDTRTVHHSAISANNGLEAQNEQDVTWVILDTGENSGYTFADGTPVNFLVGMQGSLADRGVLATSDKAGDPWEDTARYSWLNNDFRNSLPQGFRSLFKQFNVVSAADIYGNQNSTTEDYFTLAAEKEITGTQNYSVPTEATALKQFAYYETAANRPKLRGSSTDRYWTRSIRSQNYDVMVRIETSGAPDVAVATNGFGISAFGCI